MQGLTHVELTGALTGEPDLRYTPSGLAILEVTLAGEDTPPGGDRAFPWYHRATIFGTFAETIADTLKADMLTAVVGRLEERTWTTGDGANHSRAGLIVSTLKVLEAAPAELIDRDQAGQARLKRAHNHVLVMGNLTNDATLHHTKAGRPVAKLRVAVNERAPKGGERVGFYSARAWDDLAVEAVHLTKGTPVILTGRLVVESWRTRDGEPRSAVKVEAYRIDRVATPPGTPADRPSPRDATATAAPVPVGTASGGEDDGEFPPEDDLPF